MGKGNTYQIHIKVNFNLSSYLLYASYGHGWGKSAMWLAEQWGLVAPRRLV